MEHPEPLKVERGTNSLEGEGVSRLHDWCEAQCECIGAWVMVGGWCWGPWVSGCVWLGVLRYKVGINAQYELIDLNILEHG